MTAANNKTHIIINVI